ncbi:hypothetical protein NXY15_11655 [Bacteroides thetaiotaomicron]|nr:hypothetical protein NXY15_11655 [Bacteroides thetaiotaomicron]
MRLHGACKDIERPLYISKVTKKEDHTVIAYRYLDMDNIFCIPFIDDASIENALNCLAACLYLMTPADQITERMARLEPIAMRLEVKEGKNNCILINDSYNSDLASLDIALDFLVRRSEKKGLKRTLILSDILETGQSTATLYRRVAQLIKSRGINKADRCRSGDFFVCRSLRRYAGTILLPRYRRLAKIGHF